MDQKRDKNGSLTFSPKPFGIAIYFEASDSLPYDFLFLENRYYNTEKAQLNAAWNLRNAGFLVMLFDNKTVKHPCRIFPFTIPSFTKL